MRSLYDLGQGMSEQQTIGRSVSDFSDHNSRNQLKLSLHIADAVASCQMEAARQWLLRQYSILEAWLVGSSANAAEGLANFGADAWVRLKKPTAIAMPKKQRKRR